MKNKYEMIKVKLEEEYKKLDDELSVEELKDKIDEEALEKIENKMDAMEIVIDIIDEILYNIDKSEDLGKELDEILTSVF